MIATVVDTKALAETVAASLAAGVGVTIVFSVAVLGASLFAEARRDGRGGTAVVAAGLTLIGLAASASAIVVGIVVMTSK